MKRCATESARLMRLAVDVDLFVEALAVSAIVQACALLAAYCVDPDEVLQPKDVRP